jgi:hypothetical protein
MKPEQLVAAIIKEQSQIIGESLARAMAVESGVVKFNSTSTDDLTITNTDISVVLETIVNSYKKLFGEASAAVCRNVIRKYSQK